MLVLVDTNVLLRTVEPLHSHHTAAVTVLRTIKQAGHELCVVPQIHYEFWVVATRPIAQNGLNMTPTEVEVELQRLGPPLFRLLRDERTVYDFWRELVGKHEVCGKQVHDARLVAAMCRHNITHLLTFNISDFQRYSEISLLDPDTGVAP
jgi:predicted nucleic acid-binding protein